MQSRALGARIVEVLSDNDSNHHHSHNNNGHPSPRSDFSSADVTPDTSGRSSPQPTTTEARGHSQKKRRTIVHVSPYLRCLQTAIAVCSAISQSHPPAECDIRTSAGPDANAANPARSSPNAHRSLLRVDAFLGEWLCPDYFEHITPPPSSERLIAGAKAELLRRSINTVPEADMTMRPSTGYFPGGWGSASNPGSPSVEEKDQPGPLPAETAIKQRYRAGSYDSLNSFHSPRLKGLLNKINTNLSSIPDGNPSGYVPPVPSYAIASSDPIPAGYVTHARNACVNVDYQWDSMNDPQDWGSGGDYGEEWGAMHSRFSNGLENMVEWYQDHGTGDPQAKQSLNEGGGEEDDIETVLVLITHGAGCNAMVGALTGEPVLMDFSTASLTMAVRKNDNQDQPDKSASAHSTGGRKRSHSDPTGLQDYDLKLAASVDHLRPPRVSNPAQAGSTALPSPGNGPSPTVPSYRHRAASRSSVGQGPFIIGSSPAPTSNIQPRINPRPSAAPRSKSGLWGSVSNDEDTASDSADDIVPNFGGPVSSSGSNDGKAEHKCEESSSSTSSRMPQRTLSQRGLWGSPPLNNEQEAGIQRRLVVTERKGL